MISDFDLEGKNKLQKAVYYMQYYGVSYTVKKALRKFGVSVSDESEYMTWCHADTGDYFRTTVGAKQRRIFCVFRQEYQSAAGIFV